MDKKPRPGPGKIKGSITPDGDGITKGYPNGDGITARPNNDGISDEDEEITDGVSPGDIKPYVDPSVDKPGI